jgi:hypothetical protein
MQPREASQKSSVHGFPSSQAGAVPALHPPFALHDSTPLQASPSLQEFEMSMTFWQPFTASHESSVQGLPSSQALASGVCTQPWPESQLSAVQATWSSQSTGAVWQPTPASQESPVQASWSSQLSVGKRHPVAGSQVSDVQKSPSVQTMAACSQPEVESQVSSVQASWSSQSKGLPP